MIPTTSENEFESVTKRTFPRRHAINLPTKVLGSKLINAAGPEVSLISFDVFETVLTRHVGEPDAMFLEIGKELVRKGLINVSPSVFAASRREGERKARINRDAQATQEITLENIYEEITHHNSLDSSVTEFCKVEMSVEREALAAVPEMKNAIDQIRKKLGRIVFISDMYLSHDFLETILRDCGLMIADDRLYVSSTYGLQKYSTGDLFLKVLEEEGLKPSELFHCGNSQISDIEPANRHGIRTYYFEAGNCNASEKILNIHNEEFDGIGSTLAGASRRARLEGLQLDSNLQSIWNCGASVTGPLVFLYAQWIIDQAEQFGINRLLFLARDAYLPYLAVEMILKQRNDKKIEINYIYGSRPTYYALGIERLGEDEWWLLTQFSGARILTIKNLEKCFLLEKGALDKFLSKLGLESHDRDQVLSTTEAEQVRRCILKDKEVNCFILNEIRKYQNRMHRYLEGEGITPDSKIALVDSGWTTKSHAPLYRFLGKMGCSDIKIFYMGLTVKDIAVPLNSVRTFLFNRATGHGDENRDMEYARPLESLFISPHGRTEGLKEEEGVISPIFSPIENEKFLNELYAHYQAGVESFLTNASTVQYEHGGLGDYRGIAVKLLRRFWKTPTREEAKLWSKLNWEWDPLGSLQYTLAQPYKWTDSFIALRKGKWQELYPQFWTDGARQLTGPKVHRLMTISIFWGQVARKLVRRLPKSILSKLRVLRTKFHGK